MYIIIYFNKNYVIYDLTIQVFIYLFSWITPETRLTSTRRLLQTRMHRCTTTASTTSSTSTTPTTQCGSPTSRGATPSPPTSSTGPGLG